MKPLLLLLAAAPLVGCDSGDNGEPGIAAAGDEVAVRYEGRLTDGRIFQPQATSIFRLNGGLIAGFRNGVIGMREGESKTLTIPPEDGYGANPPPGSIIPPNATLIFEVELLEIR